MHEASNWCMEETKFAHLGDARLNRRYGNILHSISSSPRSSIPGSFKSWGETIAAYRFCNNENVTPDKILSPHLESTIERIKNEKTVLILQDTTEMDFTKRRQPISGMGYLSQENSHGFYLHPAIAVTPERVCLGVVNIQTWTREKLGTRHDRKNKPIEEKETYCWLKGYEAVNGIAHAAPGSVIVSISDREGDIYEVIEKMASDTNKAYWLIRAQHDRSVLDEETKKFDSRLRKKIRSLQALGEIEFTIPSGRSNGRARKARTIKQEIRSCTMTLRPPKRKEKTLLPVTINVVHCVEINPPPGEDKVEWFLLTSFPVDNADRAMDIVQWYLCRWQIEVFFKILKSGCTVEKLQFDTLEATTNCIAMYMIVAWRILYLTMLGRSCPDMDCSAVFEEKEWQSICAITTRKPPPKTPPKLNELIQMIAKLGGFLGRKGDGRPGPKVMWIGMQRMRDFTLAWEIYLPIGGGTCV